MLTFGPRTFDCLGSWVSQRLDKWGTGWSGPRAGGLTWPYRWGGGVVQLGSCAQVSRRPAPSRRQSEASAPKNEEQDKGSGGTGHPQSPLTTPGK